MKLLKRNHERFLYRIRTIRVVFQYGHRHVIHRRLGIAHRIHKLLFFHRKSSLTNRPVVISLQLLESSDLLLVPGNFISYS